MTHLLFLRRLAALSSLLLLLLLALSGWALSAGYVPSEAEAFTSVLYMTRADVGGALNRDVHSLAASGVVISGFLYLLFSYLAGRHASQRNAWWWAVSLYLLILGCCFTGFLLPMDQFAYWGNQVRLGIIESVPLVGDWIAALLRGGATFNASTLPRYFTLHASVLPLLAIPLLVPLVRRAAGGIREEERSQWLAGGVLVAVGVYLLARFLPASLELPADPADAEYVPRPEWYFLWLFQFGRLTEALPWLQSFVLPVAGLVLLYALPFFTVDRPQRRVAIAALWCVFWIALTGGALWADRDLPPKLGFEEAMRERSEEGYKELCYECHGETGRGDGPQSRAFGLDAKDFSSAELWEESTEIAMIGAILNGQGEDMPAFRRQLSRLEAEALLDYIRESFGPAAAAP